MTIASDSQKLDELRWTILVVASLMAAASAHQVYVALNGRMINAAIATLLAIGIVGIMRKVRWGRRIAVAFLWVLILVGFGSLSPFNAGDLMAEGIEPPSLLTLGLRFAGICAVALTGLHYLGKHKAMFRPVWI